MTALTTNILLPALAASVLSAQGRAKWDDARIALASAFKAESAMTLAERAGDTRRASYLGVQIWDDFLAARDLFHQAADMLVKANDLDYCACALAGYDTAQEWMDRVDARVREYGFMYQQEVLA